METRVFEQFNPGVQRGSLKYCEICEDKFGPFKKEHQCKRCLRAVCSNCATDKKDVYKLNMEKSAHRLCKICRVESDFLKDYIKTNKLEFGRDSPISKKWQDQIPTMRGSQMNIKQHRKFSYETFCELWNSYNFSLREFIGLLTFDKDQKNIYKLVNTVYLELQSRGVEERMENLIIIVVFILCFANTDSAVDLIEYLIGLKSMVTDSKQIVLTYLKTLGLAESQYKQINDYINYQCRHFINPLSINATTAESSIYTIGKAFEKERIDEIFMLLSITIQENFEILEKNKNNKIYMDYLMIRGCNLPTYTAKFKKLASVNVAQMASIRAKKNSIDREQDIVEMMMEEEKNNSYSQSQSYSSSLPKNEEYEPSSFSKKKYVGESESDYMSSPRKESSQTWQNNEKEDNDSSEKSDNDNESSSFTSHTDSRVGERRSEGIEISGFNMFSQFAQAANATANGTNTDEIKVGNSFKDEKIEENSLNSLRSNSELLQNGPYSQEKNGNTFINGMKKNISQENEDSDLSKDNSENEKNGQENGFPSQEKSQASENLKNDFEDENTLSLGKNIKNERSKSSVPSPQEDSLKIDEKEKSKSPKLNDEEKSDLLLKLKESEKRIKLLENQVTVLQRERSVEKVSPLQEKNDKIVNKLSKENEELKEELNNVKKELIGFKKENERMKMEMESLVMSNKILQKNLEEQPKIQPAPETDIEQNEKTISLLKQSLLSKNVEIQTLTKSNKSLSLKLESLEEELLRARGESAELERLRKEREGLLGKLGEISNRVVEEEGEKLELSRELLEVRRESELLGLAQLQKDNDGGEGEEGEGRGRGGTDCRLF